MSEQGFYTIFVNDPWYKNNSVTVEYLHRSILWTDMEFVRKFTQARFLKT